VPVLPGEAVPRGEAPGRGRYGPLPEARTKGQAMILNPPRLKLWEILLFTVVGLCIMAACVLGGLVIYDWLWWVFHR
jgi:hypothetical protein